MAECWFLDVGQGASNVILLGEGRGIVIDCGPKSTNVPIKLLKRHVSTIEALIISHNDADHDGGAVKILQAYPKAIKRIYFLCDRPPQSNRTYAVIKSEMKAGNLLNVPERLEAKEKPRILYHDNEAQLCLQLIYPTLMENLNALEHGAIAPNQTSGVICLFCGGKSIVFSGDAMMESWKAIAERYGSEKLPLRCEVMTIPHHGGYLVRKNTQESRDDFIKRGTEALEYLYTQVIAPRYGIISVGSSNQHNHPLPETVRVLRDNNVGVLCTQMTPHCCDNLESLRPGIIEPVRPSASSKDVKKTGAGKSKNVGCAGSIVVALSSEGIHIHNWEEHQYQMDIKVENGVCNPMCR